jgi:hypothetical protein
LILVSTRETIMPLLIQALRRTLSKAIICFLYFEFADGYI